MTQFDTTNREEWREDPEMTAGGGGGGKGEIFMFAENIYYSKKASKDSKHLTLFEIQLTIPTKS
jgi:hypothetical protein